MSDLVGQLGIEDLRIEGRFRRDRKIVLALHLRLRGMGKARPAGVHHLNPKVLMLDWPS